LIFINCQNLLLKKNHGEIINSLINHSITLIKGQNKSKLVKWTILFWIPSKISQFYSNIRNFQWSHTTSIILYHPFVDSHPTITQYLSSRMSSSVLQELVEQMKMLWIDIYIVALLSKFGKLWITRSLLWSFNMEDQSSEFT
jgi:hypothetical protein